MSILQTDANGYALPWSDHDQIIESTALDPLAGPAYIPSEGVYEPSREDVDDYLDQLERAEYERGCNARFV